MKTPKLISLLTDYGFKVSFGTENTLFLRTALALLIKSPVKLKEVKQKRNEFDSFVTTARSGIYDVHCEDEKGTRYIIEMQVGNYEWLVERMLFYMTHLYAIQAKKGKNGFSKMKPVFCICIVTDNIFIKNETFYNHFEFKNEDGSLVLSQLNFILVELCKFRKNRNQLENELDELLYTMSQRQRSKHAHEIEKSEQPIFWGKKWFEETIKKIDLNAMSPEDKMLYEMMIVRNQIMLDHDEKEQKERLEKAQKKAEKRGEIKGILKTNTKAVENLLKEGFPIEKIVSILNVTKEFVLEIKEKLELE